MFGPEEEKPLGTGSLQQQQSTPPLDFFDPALAGLGGPFSLPSTSSSSIPSSLRGMALPSLPTSSNLHLGGSSTAQALLNGSAPSSVAPVLAESAARTEVHPVPRPNAPSSGTQPALTGIEAFAQAQRAEQDRISAEQQAAIALVGVGFAPSPRIGEGKGLM